MSRNTEVERGAPDQEMTIYINEEITFRKKHTPKNATEQRYLGRFAYKIKCKWENQAKKAELRLGGKQE
jgi:hypothetical protein